MSAGPEHIHQSTVEPLPPPEVPVAGTTVVPETVAPVAPVAPVAAGIAVGLPIMEATALGAVKLNPFGDLHTLQHVSARLARSLRPIWEPLLRHAGAPRRRRRRPD